MCPPVEVSRLQRNFRQTDTASIPRRNPFRNIFIRTQVNAKNM